MKHSIKISILMVIAIISNSNLFAATKTWNGSSNTSWNTGANWSGNTVPTSSDDVIIPSGLTNYPTLDASTASLRSITINGGTLTQPASGTSRNISATTITVNSGGTLVRGIGSITSTTIVLSGGTINISLGNKSLPNLTYNSGTLTLAATGSSVNTFNMTAGSFTHGSNNLTITTLNANGGTFTRGSGTLTLSNLTINGGTYINGSSNLTMTGTFTLEQDSFTNGAWNLSASTFVLNSGVFTAGSGSVSVTNNDLDINTGAKYIAGSGNLNLSGNIVIASAGEFVGGSGLVNANGGDFQVDANGTATIAYNKLVITSGNALLVYGDFNFTGTGDINIAGGVTLYSTGNLNLNNNKLIIGQSYYLRGGNVSNPGDTVRTTTFTIRYNNTVVLDYVVKLTGTMEFRDSAKLVTSSTYPVVFEYNAGVSTSSGRTPSNISHINGPVVKKISSTNTTPTFNFPIGDGTNYAPLEISSYGNRRNEDFFVATYYSSRNPNAGKTKGTGLNLVSQAEYWILDRNASSGTPTTTATVKLSYNTSRSGAITDAALLKVARWDGTQWVDHGRASGSSTNTTSGTLSSSANVTSFSPFTLGSSSNVNPLPVHLLDFNAVAVASNVNVKWSTTSEINNDFFNVEKSLDGKIWSVIGTVKGAGNTESLTNYNFVDANPVAGIQYYRLKQTDVNGEFNYSSIAPVNFSNTLTSSINIFPMPANNFINVELPGATEMLVTIFNANGQIVFESTSGSLLNIDIQDFNAGLYIVEVKADNSVVSSKFLKN